MKWIFWVTTFPLVLLMMLMVIVLILIGGAFGFVERSIFRLVANLERFRVWYERKIP